MEEKHRFERELQDLELEAVISSEKTRWIQAILNRVEGHDVAVDGVFGRKTRQAIMDFQARHGLADAGGLVGAMTTTALVQTALNFISQQSLVPINGIMDERTIEEIKIFQSKRSLVPDGIIGRKTREAMRNLLLTFPQMKRTTAVPPITTRVEGGGGPSVVQSALDEWQAHPKIHRHFEKGFQTYLELRQLYMNILQPKGIQNPAEYLDKNIVELRFFDRRTPGHTDLRDPLMLAEDSLRRQNIRPSIQSFWAFVPRKIAGTQRLSNHAFGRAIDINPSTNPHILLRDDITIILAATGVDLGKEQKNHDIMRNASKLFQNIFNQDWIDRQPAHLQQIIRTRRKYLDKYARNGFFNLQQPLINALTKVGGFKWGGSWRTQKDFMHFDM